MTGFHTWRRRYEGVSQNSGYGYEESHLIHDMTIFHTEFHFCMEYGVMYVCHCMCILGGELPL